MATATAPAEGPASVPAGDEDGPPRPSAVRRVAVTLGGLLGGLLVPDRTLPAAVGDGRYGAPLAAVVLAALVAAAAIGERLDVRAVADPPGPPRGGAPGMRAGGGEPPVLPSDREVAERIATRLKVERVKLGLSAGLATPAKLFLLALALYGLGRYVGGTPTVRRAMAAASHAALPGAVKSLLAATAALRHAEVTLAEIPGLVPPGSIAPRGSPVATRLLAGVDPFLLWSVVLCGFGLAAAAQVSRRKAFVTIVVAFLLYLAITRGIMGGAPPPTGAPT